MLHLAFRNGVLLRQVCVQFSSQARRIRSQWLFTPWSFRRFRNILSFKHLRIHGLSSLLCLLLLLLCNLLQVLVAFFEKLLETPIISNLKPTVSRSLLRLSPLVEIFSFDNLKQVHPMIQTILSVHFIIQPFVLLTVVGTQSNKVAWSNVSFLFFCRFEFFGRASIWWFTWTVA